MLRLLSLSVLLLPLPTLSGQLSPDEMRRVQDQVGSLQRDAQRIIQQAHIPSSGALNQGGRGSIQQDVASIQNEAQRLIDQGHVVPHDIRLSQKDLDRVKRQEKAIQKEAQNLINQGQVPSIPQLSKGDLLLAKRQAESLQKEAEPLIAQGDGLLEKKPRKGCPSQFAKGLAQPKQTGSKILVFVSFSMPDVSLRSLANEAQRHNAVLVIKGLYQDSFVKTAHKVKDFQGTLDINPELFDKHDVKVVPTFIQVKDDQALNRLSGNVSLAFCSEKFGEGS